MIGDVGDVRGGDVREMKEEIGSVRNVMFNDRSQIVPIKGGENAK